MKHVHFFGCSITAGDELTDHIHFPWKKEITDADTYFKMRLSVLYKNGDEYNQSYVDDNKKLAYPAQLEKISNDIRCYNHAGNGASQGEMTYRLLKLIYTKQPIDYVFFQIPPPDRELVFDDKEPRSLQHAFHTGHTGVHNNISSYLKYKLLSFRSFTPIAAALLDLIFVKETLTAHNIPYTILDMIGHEPEVILQDYPEYHWMLDHGIELDNPFLYIQKETTLGRHFTLETHIRLAEYLKNKYRL